MPFAQRVLERPFRRVPLEQEATYIYNIILRRMAYAHMWHLAREMAT